ncbi:MAG: SpoIIE family protein phosphatase, partial [Bacteroidetes bacterium]|nr:SpoIIE family protein phosphatase [Bacteroidota bacterium]
LLELLLKNKSKNPEVLIDLIINEVNNFAAGQPQMDDMTIIVIKRD